LNNFYVGLPLAIRFSDVGLKVIGFDVDDSKIKAIESKTSYIEHIPSGSIARSVEQGLTATTDFSRAGEVDALIICVPTPLNDYREPDLSFVTATMDSLAPHMRAGQLLSLESTTYPGTTVEELQPRIEAHGHKIGVDVFLVYSPEREDPANPDFTTQTIPKVCGGVTPDCLRAGVVLYEKAVDSVVQVSSPAVAEMTKLLENTDKMGIDIFEVIEAAATKPFGFVPYWPGPGLGGHCIPIDPFYLTWKAREYGVNTRFIELAGEINRSMPEWVIGKVASALNEHKKSINGSSVLVLGIAYKKNVDDMRESPSVELMELLEAKGATIAYSDPHVPVFPKLRQHHFDLSSVELTPESVSQYDLVLLATDHAKFDYPMLAKHSKLLVDTRGVYRDPEPGVIKA